MPASTVAHAERKSRSPRKGAANGLPDPRPVTDYTVSLSTSGGTVLVEVTLSQPCVIHAPNWALIDVDTGARVYAASVSVLSNTQFTMLFPTGIADTVCFIEPPYQDTQVQNFQGGFVRPGGQWFRAPVK